MLERLGLIALLLALVGCDSRAASSSHAAPAVSPAARAAAPRLPAPAPTPATAPTPTPSPGPAVSAGGSEQAAAELAQAMGTLQQTMNAMRDAAKEAGGESACEHGYLSRVAADRARQRTLDQSPLTARAPRPRWVIAPHDRYVALCETLPESLHCCASFERYQDNREGCENDIAELTLAQRNAWHELFHEEPAVAH